MKPRTYNYNDEVYGEEKTEIEKSDSGLVSTQLKAKSQVKSKRKPKKRFAGFLAQELKEIFPEMVGASAIKGQQYYDANLSNLQIYLVKAMQEQQSMINDLKKVVKRLKNKINKLEKK